MVCFCDIPVEDLPLHMKKYSQFGLAFSKGFLIGKGATPVFYVSETSLVRENWKFPSPAGRNLLLPLKEVFDNYEDDWYRLLDANQLNRTIGNMHFSVQR